MSKATKTSPGVRSRQLRRAGRPFRTFPSDGAARALRWSPGCTRRTFGATELSDGDEIVASRRYADEVVVHGAAASPTVRGERGQGSLVRALQNAAARTCRATHDEGNLEMTIRRRSIRWSGL